MNEKTQFIKSLHIVYPQLYLSLIHIWNWSRWVQQVYYLDKGNNIDIIITGNTLVGNYEP